jgi:hypothetical protein
MVKVARWSVFLVSLYALLATTHFYVTHPQEILDFSSVGLYRLALLSFAGFACYKISRVLLRAHGSGAGVTFSSEEAPSANATSGADSSSRNEHPVRAAFRKRPRLVAALLLLSALFAFSLPFLLALASPAAGPRSDATYWQRVLLWELFVAGALVIAWHRAKRLNR